MMAWVSAAALAARGVHIRIATLLIVLLAVLIAIGIIYAVSRFLLRSRRPPGGRQGGHSPRDREEPRSWQ